ncbi:hypothetical protein DES49_1594 [Halospina denitrificans]|uniref:Uncharacterized protein n=1 Tax=Halospina denitrificans TaxID=332522 RepID=A0A4R7JWT5_9GAMM|nr:hypothetical protein DES49_1594 [Halospina denitrificans]
MSAYTTIQVATLETGVSKGLLIPAIARGEVRAWSIAGETVVVLSDVRSFKARIMADRGCESCD